MRFDKLVEVFSGLMPELVPMTNLFVDKLPDAITEGVLLTDTGSDGTAIDTYIHKLRKGRFQVIVRSPDKGAGRALAESIAEKVCIEGQLDVGEVRFFFIKAIAEPISFPAAVSGLFEHSINFLTAYAIIG